MSLINEVRSSLSLPPPEMARYIRKAARVTQGRLAMEIGVDRVTLARWESGTCKPRSAQRVRYAEALTALQKELAS